MDKINVQKNIRVMRNTKSPFTWKARMALVQNHEAEAVRSEIKRAVQACGDEQTGIRVFTAILEELGEILVETAESLRVQSQAVQEVAAGLDFGTRGNDVLPLINLGGIYGASGALGLYIENRALADKCPNFPTLDALADRFVAELFDEGNFEDPAQKTVLANRLLAAVDRAMGRRDSQVVRIHPRIANQ